MPMTQYHSGGVWMHGYGLIKIYGEDSRVSTTATIDLSGR